MSSSDVGVKAVGERSFDFASELASGIKKRFGGEYEENCIWLDCPCCPDCHSYHAYPICFLHFWVANLQTMKSSFSQELAILDKFTN